MNQINKTLEHGTIKLVKLKQKRDVMLILGA